MECLRKSRIPLLLAYGYLFLPFLLFAGGWLKWYVAAPVIAALLYVFYRMARGAPALWSPVWNRRAVWKLLAILCVIAVWVFFSGIGKFTFQNEDHNTRNVMFDMLVEGDWPLVYENPRQNTTASRWPLPTISGSGCPRRWWARLLAWLRARSAGGLGGARDRDFLFAGAGELCEKADCLAPLSLYFFQRHGHRRDAVPRAGLAVGRADGTHRLVGGHLSVFQLYHPAFLGVHPGGARLGSPCWPSSASAPAARSCLSWPSP